MPDNFNSAYLATRKDRHKGELDALLAADEKYLQAQQPKASQAPSPAPAAPKKESSPGVVGEGLKAVAGGVTDAVRNTWNAIDDAATWLDNNFLDLRMGSDTIGQIGGRKASGKPEHKASLQVAPLVSPNETTGGQIARSVTQFVVPFLGATKALRAAGMASTAARGAAAGAATDFAAFDPHEKRLSNLVMDFSDGNPAFGKPLFEYLAADPSDSAMEGRFKNTLEGLGLGVALEGVFKGAKAVKAHYAAKGQNPAQAIQEVAGAARKEAEDLTAHAMDTSKAPTLDLADQIDLLTGVSRNGPSKFQKALDMKAAIKDADTAKGLDYTPTAVPKATDEGLSLAPKDALPYEKGAAGDVPSFPEQWKLVEEDPAPRKAFFDPEEGTVQFAREAQPHQLDLDLSIPEALQKAERSPDEEAMLKGYQELQETVLAKAPQEPAQVAGKGSQDLQERIAAAQKRVDDLMDAGKDTTAAQRVLDGLLKKADGGLFDHAGKLSAKEADQLATKGDKVVDAIAANNERLLAAYGRQQGGFISPSMLGNLASLQAGAVTGYLSAEDDATFAERLSMAGAGAMAGWGIKVGASKVLKGHERAAIEGASPEVRSLARPEVANIAPLTATQKKLPVIARAKVDKLVEAARNGGMESLAKAVKESDFNFAHIDTAEDVKATIDAFSEVFEKETSLAKHGTQTFGDIQALADELGAGVSSLKELYHGTQNLGARILAHRALLTASAEQVTKLVKLAVTGDSEGILALRKQVALHASIQAQMKGVQTEVGRALASFRITSSSLDLAINERNQLIDAMGGHAANIKFAQQLADITDPKQLNAVIRKSAYARTQDALYEAWVNGLLSGPVTHAVNAVGNGLVAIASPAERLVAGMWGKVLRSGDDAVKMGEAKAQLFGMAEGFKDAIRITAHGLEALKKSAGETLHGNFSGARETLEDASGEFGNAWKAAATDMPVLDNAAYGTREFDLQGGAISASSMGLDPKAITGMAADGLGALIRTPGRLLTTTDEIFKTIHYRGELKAQAYRQATAEGLHGDALFKRVAELVEDPTPEVAGMALDAARKGTFTAPLGEYGRTTSKLIQMVPGGRWLVPFVRTPTNIMKFVGVRTPGLNLLADSVKADLAAGGARRDMALARTTVGGTLYAAAGYMAAQGLITGGGEKINTAERLSGWQPYSVKVGNKYIAYNRMDPFGMFLGLAADVVDLSGHLDASEVDDLASMAVLAVSRNLVSKSYASGIVQFIEAISQPEAKLERWSQNLLASTVPAAVNALRKEEDPLVREVWSYTDALKNRIPGLSKGLPPKRNVFGEPISVIGGLGPDIVSPFRTTVESTDPLAQELARLNIDLRQPPKTLFVADGAKGIDLTPEQYDKLVETGGAWFKEALASQMKDSTYATLTEGNPDYQDGKEKLIQGLHTRAKLIATRKLLADDNDLRERWYAGKKDAFSALTGQPALPF